MMRHQTRTRRHNTALFETLESRQLLSTTLFHRGASIPLTPVTPVITTPVIVPPITPPVITPPVVTTIGTTTATGRAARFFGSSAASGTTLANNSTTVNGNLSGTLILTSPVTGIVNNGGNILLGVNVVSTGLGSKLTIPSGSTLTLTSSSADLPLNCVVDGALKLVQADGATYNFVAHQAPVLFLSGVSTGGLQVSQCDANTLVYQTYKGTYYLTNAS